MFGPLLFGIAHQIGVAPLPANVQSILERPELKGAAIAVAVAKLDGTIIAGSNPFLKLTPASNNKLFSAAFAFETLGPKRQIQTRFWRSNDNVIVEATGDPLLSTQDLTVAKQALGISGRGTVWVYQSFDPGWQQNWELGDLPNIYAPPVTAFTLDRGRLELNVEQGRLTLKPGAFGIRILRSPATQTSDVFDPFKKTITVFGALPKEGVLDTLALPDPVGAAASYLGSRMASIDSVPSRPADYVHHGGALEDLMRVCLQESDNQIAESLLFMAATALSPMNSTYETAIPALETFLHNSVGLDDSMVQEDDGSGLSRENSVCPAALVKLLAWMSTRKDFDIWKSELDRPGLGTLKTRLKGVSFVGKTGSMTRVSALSGYLETENGPLIISIIDNGFSFSAAHARGIEDEIVEKILADAANGTLPAYR